MTDPVLIGVVIGLAAGLGVVLMLSRRNGRRDEHAAVNVPPQPAVEFEPEPPPPPNSPFPVECADEAPAQPASVEPSGTSALDLPPASLAPTADAPGPDSPGPDESHELSSPAALPYAAGLVAPVELWIGDTRVVVKDGTRTQLQFRSYADSLLSALKEAKDVTR